MNNIILINVIAVIIFLFLGCATKSPYNQLADETEHYGLYSYGDKKTTCYVYSDKNSSTISCVKGNSK